MTAEIISYTPAVRAKANTAIRNIELEMALRCAGSELISLSGRLYERAVISGKETEEFVLRAAQEIEKASRALDEFRTASKETV